MAFYNPQRVVFDPNNMVIQNAGALGGAIYNAFKNYNEAQEKRFNTQREFEQKQNELDFNQALANNQLLQKEREFDYNTQRDLVKDYQWQQNYDLDRYYKTQTLANNKYAKDIQNQKNLLELKKLENEINNQQNLNYNQNIFSPEFNQMAGNGGIYETIKEFKDKGIDFRQVQGLGNVFYNKLSNNPFSKEDSINFSKRFTKALKSDINLLLANDINGRLSNEDRQRLEDILKLDDLYFWDKYASQDYKQINKIIYNVKANNLKKEYEDLRKKDIYFKYRKQYDDDYAKRANRLLEESKAINDFLNLAPNIHNDGDYSANDYMNSQYNTNTQNLNQNQKAVLDNFTKNKITQLNNGQIAILGNDGVIYEMSQEEAREKGLL